MTRRMHQDAIVGLMIIIFSITFFTQTFKMTSDAAIYPQGILIIFALFGASILLSGMKKTTKIKTGKDDQYPEGEEERLHWKVLKSPMSAFTMIALYILLINITGFFSATTVFVLFFMRYIGAKGWVTYVSTTVGFNLFIYLLFVMQLNVQLPRGILF